MDPSDRIQALIKWIRTTAASAQGLLVPVSGGSDSALGFWLCARAFPQKTVAMHAQDGGALRCRDWFDSVGIVVCTETPGHMNQREEMRWARFLSYSIRRGQWLVGCRNRTEQELGTYSLASRASTFAPLIGVWKSHVMEMCATIGVPQEILDSSARADPDCGRPQEMAEIPFARLDAYLRQRAGEPVEHSLNEAQAQYIESVLKRNAFKGTLPIHGPIL
jgi:NH3-dependent NAD+ synthetase